MISIQKLIVKYKFEIIAFTLLTVFYFFLRLYNIMSLPIFTDESIYVRWSQIARWDAAWRFISLTDGKQPMFVWIALNFMRLIEDPLLASRLVSVMAGFFTMIGLYLLGKELFRNRFVGIISAFLYLIYPFALVYDRMALYDSLVGTFAVWGLYFEILLVRRIRLDVALILSMVLGAGILTKTSGFFNIYLIPTLLILFNFKDKNKKSIIVKWAILSALSVAISYVYYFVLRLSPFYHIINEKNSIFVYSFGEWIINPLAYLDSNLHGLLDWLYSYLTLPVLLLVFVSYMISFKYFREKLLLTIWFLAPFLALALFGKTIYPRFIFFMTLPLLPLAAFSIKEVLNNFGNKSLGFIIAFVFLLFFFKTDYFILTDFSKAGIAKADISQYINDWPAGGGIKEVIDYLDKKSVKEKIYVVSLGTFGSLPTYSVEIYLGDNKNVEKRGIFPVPPQIPEDLLIKSKKMPVFVFVSNQKEFEAQIKTWPLDEIMKIRKGSANSFTWLYRVRSS